MDSQAVTSGFPSVPVSLHTRRPYRERCARYEVAADRLMVGGLSDRHSLVDIGAGHTELDVCLRTLHAWRGRYQPVDRWTGLEDLETWNPPMRWDWAACLEVLEHLAKPGRLLRALMSSSVHGVVVTTPNPAVVDVFAMDSGHISPIDREQLANFGFYTSLHNFYGTVDDGICGVWYREGVHVVERELVARTFDEVAP